MNFDIMAISVGEMAEARTQRISARLVELQQAVRQAQATVEDAARNVPAKQKALEEAESLLLDTQQTVAEHLEAAGLGLKTAMASNPAAQQRELTFRVDQSDPVQIAIGQANQARTDLKTARQAVEHSKDALGQRLAELQSFITKQVEL